MSVSALIFIFFVMANLPWLTDRLFLFFPLKNGKSIIFRIMELVLFYGLSLLVAMLAEIRFSGEVFSQEWEFFVVTFCLFLVLSVPGIIYRFEWLPMQK